VKLLSHAILLLLVSVSSATAQLDPNRLIPSPETIGAAVFDVLPDARGNIWMATQSGLLRYDGYEMHRYYPDLNNPKTIGNILSYGLYIDHKGIIWIGCMGYVSSYDPVSQSFVNFSFTEYTDFPIYAQSFVYSIASDFRGRVYFGVSSFLNLAAKQALFYFDYKESKLKRFEYPDDISISNITGLTSDPHHNIWINSQSGIFMIDTLHQIHRIRLPHTDENRQNYWISTIESTPSGMIRMARNDFRLFEYNPGSDTYSSWSFNEISGTGVNDFWVNKMIIDSSGNTWMGSNHGLIFFNRQKGTFDHIFDRKNYSDPTIFGIRFDSFGDLWMATNAHGLMRYSARPILNSFIHDDKNNKSITGGWANKIFDDEEGSVWIATEANIQFSGITRFDPISGTITPYPYHNFLPGMEYYNVTGMTGPGEFLISTNQGNFRSNPVTGKYQKTTLGGLPDSIHIFCSYKDSKENTCYGTADGLFITYKTGETRHFQLSALPASNLTSNEVTKVWESERSGLWILTNNGLFLYQFETDSIQRFGFEIGKGDILPSQDINSFYEDPEGIAWVGTWQGGLCRLDPGTGKIKTYTVNDGLPSMAIQGILADEKYGVLWLSTFEGISRFNINDESFNNFSLEDGIQGTLFSDGAYLRTSGGTFIFGGNNGITYFKDDDVATKSLPPLVYITEFKVADSSLSPGIESGKQQMVSDDNRIFLSHGQNNISFDYTGIHYANPSRNQFAYKLENYDKDWRYVKNTRTAYYYNLPPGKYTFRVKAANSTGVWNEEGASLDFTIAPPWWKTWWAYLLYGVWLIAAIFSFDRIQRRRLLERERRQAREKELAHAKEIEKAYTELKVTQSQLIQSEKMASLGELTAGIAHEIQNPLNFVNNFSEVSTELLDEMKQELAVGSWQLAGEIADDIKQNLEKILHHGKRADAIVKGMLQHSRTSTGQKVLTDINTLADEYLRLAYHGLRAKDKDFNAVLKTDFDETIGNINVIPQDIGRVILNLITNAFYAVDEKKKQLASDLSALSNLTGQKAYEPTVTVSTKRSLSLQGEGRGEVLISVKDNGSGIPAKVLEKIFQPFFTTKPTGQGTGLGLSLSYDIITKGHNGVLKLETKEGEGSVFIIQLPVINN
jgi:signal transduction histidine kinase/streptogramin lyase